MNIPSEAHATSAGCDNPIDEIRRIFEFAVALDVAQRNVWLVENVRNSATRHVVSRLLEADGQPGLLDISVMQLLDAMYCTSDQASHATSTGRAP